MKVVSCDEQEFEIDQNIIKQSKLLKIYFEDDLNEPIILSQIRGSILKSVIEFCEHHKNDTQLQIDDEIDDDDNVTSRLNPQITFSEWDCQFVKKFTVREEKLFDIITAANYLGIDSLLHVLCKTFITMIRGKSSSEIAELFSN